MEMHEFRDGVSILRKGRDRVGTMGSRVKQEKRSTTKKKTKTKEKDFTLEPNPQSSVLWGALVAGQCWTTTRTTGPLPAFKSQGGSKWSGSQGMLLDLSITMAVIPVGILLCFHKNVTIKEV